MAGERSNVAAAPKAMLAYFCWLLAALGMHPVALTPSRQTIHPVDKRNARRFPLGTSGVACYPAANKRTLLSNIGTV